jgi:hypothetical protein
MSDPDLLSSSSSIPSSLSHDDLEGLELASELTPEQLAEAARGRANVDTAGHGQEETTEVLPDEVCYLYSRFGIVHDTRPDLFVFLVAASDNCIFKSF